MRGCRPPVSVHTTDPDRFFRVLELPEPETLDFQGFAALWQWFLAYTISFFWLGAIWVNIHSSYQSVERISQRTVWMALPLLCFSSFFPYTTKLVSLHFSTETVQAIYGIVGLLVTFCSVAYRRGLAADNPGDARLATPHWLWWDIAIKCLGLVLTFTVWVSAVTRSILATLVLLVLPAQFRSPARKD